VKEVLGDAGILLDHKQPRYVAAVITGLMADPGRRKQLVDAGRSRLRALDIADAGNHLVEAILGVRDAAAARR
jgi:hypothetical protein